MELVHTCSKYGYMQAQITDMHDLEKLSPNDMSYGKSNQWTYQNLIRKVMP